MFLNVITIVSAIIVFLHGLVHLMGTSVYWQLTEIQGLVYKTTVLNGRLDIGDAGIRVFGFFWLVAALGFSIAAYGMVRGLDWWRPFMIGTAVLSLVITGLDWKEAYAGVILNLVILVALFLLPRFT